MGQETKHDWTQSQKKAMEIRDKLLLVSAAAGSGKTSVLTERVIRRILDKDDPVSLSELLIVTFTRAAAAELKSKIADAVGKALAEDPGNRRLSDQLLLLGSAQISTIDAFFQQAVRANFERVGLPASFRIAEANETDVIEREIMEETLSDLYRKYEPAVDASDPAAIFRKVSENRFADCMDHIFGGSSSSDICEALILFRKRFETDPRGTALLADLAAGLRRDAERDFSETHHGRTIISKICAAVSSFRDAAAQYEIYRVTDPENYPKTAANMAADAEACERLLAAQNAPWETFHNALNLFVIGNYPGGKKAPWQDEYRDLRNECKNQVKDLQTALKTVSAVTIREDYLKTADLAEMLNELYGTFNARLNAEKKMRGICDFNDIRNALYQLLEGPDGSRIAEELCGKYREIYIDEYQDVDEIQDRIFAILGGDRRFMVGDIKQSIYAFRGSEPAVFADYRRSMPLYTDPAADRSDRVCVFMSENFRCDKTVIDFANTVCSFLFSACRQSVGYLPSDDLVHQKNDGPEQAILPVIRVFDLPDRKKKEEVTEGKTAVDETLPPKEREAAWVAAEISRLLREEHLNKGQPIRPEDIVILSRAGKDKLSPFQKALEALGIPVIAPEAESLASSPVLIDLFNLLHSVDNPYRDLPLSEYLTSESGGFSLEELNAARNGMPEEQSLYETLTAVAADPGHPLSEKAHAFTEWLARYRELAVSLSVDRFLRILYLDPRLSAHAATPEYLALYEQARVYGRSSWCGLYGFLDYADRLLAADKIRPGGFGAPEKGVRLMTMHASKGLEFPVVFLVRCGAMFTKKDKEGALLYNRQGGFAASLFNEQTASNSKTLLQTALGYDFDAEIGESEIRLLYVALTRARERLYITAAPTTQTNKNIRDAASVHHGDREKILSANCFYSFIHAALCENARANGPAVADERHIAPEEAIEGIPWSKSTAPTPEGADPTATPDATEARVAHFRELLDRASETPYPLDHLRGIPTKAAASRLRPDLLDVLNSDEKKAVAERIRELRKADRTFDGFLSAHRAPSPAEIGTATHAFLEFCDLPNLTPDGIDGEMERLVSRKFITPETAAIADRKVLRAFAASPLIGEVKVAARVLREQKFGLFLPLGELTADRALAERMNGHELFVQGSIDLILVQQDGRVDLYDYKTDRVTPEERADRALLLTDLKARHGNQLACYARAVKNLFGRRPDKTCLFMLALGEAVEI